MLVTQHYLYFLTTLKLFDFILVLCKLIYYRHCYFSEVKLLSDQFLNLGEFPLMHIYNVLVTFDIYTI